jgi:hypothetical protein
MTSKDFSVIVQGPIIGKPGEDYEKQKTLHCLKSVKEVLPDAEIILSTWKGSDCSHLLYDKLILNDDPGAITYNDYELKNVFNNNNRQIVSTYNGLRTASRKYAIKIRGDFKLKDASFVSLMHKFIEVNKYHFFKHRILVPTYVSRDPEKIPLLYHISDLFQVGFADDLRDLWDIPLQPEPETTRAFPYNTLFINNPFRTYKYSMKFAAEQYIWYAFAKKKGLNLGIKYYCQTPIGITYLSLVSIIDNFIVASPEQLGIVIPESITHKFNQRFLYTHEKWKKLYVEFCIEKSNYKIRKHVFLITLCSIKNILKNKVYLPAVNIKSLFKR